MHAHLHQQTHGERHTAMRWHERPRGGEACRGWAEEVSGRARTHDADVQASPSGRVVALDASTRLVVQCISSTAAE